MENNTYRADPDDAYQSCEQFNMGTTVLLGQQDWLWRWKQEDGQ